MINYAHCTENFAKPSTDRLTVVLKTYTNLLMAINELLPSHFYQHPNQSPCLYDNNKSWEENRVDGPNWKGTFPILLGNEIPDGKIYPFVGFNLRTPIAIAAGPGAGKEWTDFYFKMGYPLVVQKTHRTKLHPSNERPNLAVVLLHEQLTRERIGKPVIGSLDFEEYVGAVANSYGNPEDQTLFQIAREIQAQKKTADKYNAVLFSSVTATLDEDLDRQKTVINASMDVALGGSVIAGAGAQGIEDNKACPNVGKDHPEGQMFQDPKMIINAASEFRVRNPGIPFGVKFGVFPSKDAMKAVFVEVGDMVNYWSGINTIGMEVLDKNGQPVLPGRPFIGVSGGPILYIALEQTKWAAEIRVEEGLHYDLLMGGGIKRPAHVEWFLNSGANCTQIGNTAYFNPLFHNDYLLYKYLSPRYS